MSGVHTEPSVPTRSTPPGGEPPGPPAPAGGDGGREPTLRPPRRSVGWGVALVAAGALWLLSLAGVTLRLELLLPAALIVVGVLVLALPRARAGGLVGLGVVLLVLTLVLVVAPGTSSVSAGDRTHTVTDVADLDDYRLGAGTLVLDLRGLELTEAVEVSAQVGMGELIVHAPDETPVEGRARVGLGEVDGFGESTGGIAPRLDLGETDTATDPVLTLDLQVGMGRIEVGR